ncbi:hypothetical protein Lalb_Chr21g0307131 [Lupinus albus]|uniref:S-protein homolog n=1 Tax=Lupinus albus TaxID=3870 RepID=A0A6A4NIL0_LUPAL|nr:hypothetical protein Lalb_Chr21g0307131 [Lupinus albus]
MSTSIHVVVSFLVVVMIICFNNSIPTFADSNLFIEISNDMSSDHPGIFFIYNLTGTHIPLVQGQPWSITTDSATPKYCMIFWDILCSNFDLYNPSKYGIHSKTYWSVRTDGLYNSYDKGKWEKKESWRVRGYLGHCD